MKLEGIEQALKKGCKMHGFTSGGGLRVIRIEKKEKLKGYGEHPNVEDALSHANEDFLAGGRPYKKVYGGLKPHYLTGSSEATSELDEWLLRGQTFDSFGKGKDVVVELRGYAHTEIPKSVMAEVDRTRESVTWSNRGYTYRTTPSRMQNEKGYSTKVINGPDKGGADPWLYHIIKRGVGEDFSSALEKALNAKEVEEN